MAARVGIDLGTTNTVVALADRGNYPVLPVASGGETRLSLPTVLCTNGREVRTGWDALACWDERGWDPFGSPKRSLGVPQPELPPAFTRLGPTAGDCIEESLRLILSQIREEILNCPSLEGEDEIEAMIGVPANANSLQRLRTWNAARRAGFSVLGLTHEPTAAAIEYAHRHPAFGRGKELRHVLVYDLGGGTFDAAVVQVTPDGFAVVCSAGVERLGGDDFDAAMAELALAKAGLSWAQLPWSARFRLLRRCREAKEALRGTTKKWLLDLEDLGAGEVPVYAAEYAERCGPLIDQTLRTLEGVLATSQLDFAELDALLMVGGGSQMYLVQRRLKDLVGTRLKISPHPFASTAVGLAVHADRAQTTTQPVVRERFSRNFGVFREVDGGAGLSFDTIFSSQTPLPAPGEKLVVRRVYHPAHNIGRFRFEECSELDPAGFPAGDCTPWCAICFPFDPALDSSPWLEGERVVRSARVAQEVIEERYECDSRGMITVQLSRSEPALSCTYLLYGPERVAAIRPPRRSAASGHLASGAEASAG